MKSIARMIVGIVCGFLLVIPLNILGLYVWIKYNYMFYMNNRKLYIHIKYSNKLSIRIYYMMVVAYMKSIAASLDDNYKDLLILFLES